VVQPELVQTAVGEAEEVDGVATDAEAVGRLERLALAASSSS